MKVEIVPPPKVESQIVLTLSEKEAELICTLIARLNLGDAKEVFKVDVNAMFELLTRSGIAYYGIGAGKGTSMIRLVG